MFNTTTTAGEPSFGEKKILNANGFVFLHLIFTGSGNMKNPTSDGEALREVFKLVEDWIGESRDSETPVIDYKSPVDLQAELNLNIPEVGRSNSGIIDEINSYLKHAVKTSNPAYLNQLFGGFGFPGFVGEIITALTNTSMYTYEVAPVATLLEKALLEKMISFTEWGSGDGIFTSGGSNSNLYAMILARNSMFRDAKMEGITALPKLAILVSEHSHFSLLKGANTIGIGQNGVIKVKTDEFGRMRGKDVEEAIEDSVGKGLVPFMLCSTAGTTETGSFDVLEELATVAEKHGLWHHVDGSWGGSLILCPEYRDLFKGLERADSFTWNPHKLMSVPLVCSAFLVKNKEILRREISTNDADYIYHDYDASDFDTGPSSLACGRRVDSLKLWLSWQYWGDEGYRRRIAKCMKLAEYATDWVEKSPDLEMMFPTQTLNVNFRFKSEDDPDEFNRRLRYELIREGLAMVNYCNLENGLSIRLILLNPDLEREDLDRFFERLVTKGKELRSAHREIKSSP